MGCMVVHLKGIVWYCGFIGLGAWLCRCCGCWCLLVASVVCTALLAWCPVMYVYGVFWPRVVFLGRRHASQHHAQLLPGLSGALPYPCVVVWDVVLVCGVTMHVCSSCLACSTGNATSCMFLDD
ncbi:hypothetical protein COO60DRAFT_192269 [Scenedesmus sp. NREL 46B-D3]|nr:hypothetical protein COO60DRAFT_192269 [Scenedesmus sp. NREL 46B-D3]